LRIARWSRYVEAPSPKDRVVEADQEASDDDLLKRAMAGLTPRELDVIRRHMLADPSETLEAIGADWDVTGEAMRQCELKAMSKLKQRARLLRWGEEAPKAAPAPAPAEQPKRGRGRAGRAA
jgi:DNA-directed RNA polymerase sigma subunit (sigma70/sigma32)